MSGVHRWFVGLSMGMIVVGWNAAARGAVHDLAADYIQPPSTSPSTNPSGPWTYGYMSAGSFTHTNTSFLTTGVSNGFVAYNMVGNAGGGGGSGWTTGFGFPFAGVWNVPPTAASVAPYPSLTDFPSAEGDNPAYPDGVLGGHAPNCNFCSGWYAVKYTATSTGPVDIEAEAWQTAIYPNVPPNPEFGGATRSQQTLIQKQVGSTYTDLLRSPLVTRHGITNESGTPEHTMGDAPTPGRGESYATQQDEIDAAMRSSARPNLYRLTNVNLNAGESIIISYAPYMGENFVGFLGFNEVLRTGADRIATTRWDLSDDWSANGATASGIGPDAAWSYGIRQNGNFTPYDKIVFGVEAENTGTPERENNGWGEPLGWFVSSAINEEGPIVPGMSKAVDGVNSLTGGFAGGVFSEAVTGDWTGGKVAIHTPTAEVDADQTSVIRWTAPRNMSVDASGGLWRATLPDDVDRRHQFTLLHNGSEIASGTIEELGFDCGAGDTNSACPLEFNMGSIAVSVGDTLDLEISPLQVPGSPDGDYNGDNVVDAADYVVWRKNDGSPGGYDTWRANFGATGGVGTSATASFVGVDFTVVESLGEGALSAIPESASLILLLVGSMITAMVRIRRSN
ncbi:MAG: hypothetical protein WD738_10340 [Pirellulales bacterium]